MVEQIVEPGKRVGTIQISPSKSDSQRALLAAALAKGVSTLQNVGKSADELKMLEVIQQLGAVVSSEKNNTLSIQGIETYPAKLDLNLGESGLGVRLLISLCAAHKGYFSITGEGTLIKRPLTFFDKEFKKLGVNYTSNNGFLPCQIKGRMKAKEITVDGSQSSQYISGLLMSLPLLDATSYLTVQNVKSVPYIQMTINTLEAFGIVITHKEYTDFIIGGNQKYLPTNYTIESDWSSASFWLVASALGAEITVQGLSMSSLQADKKILNAFIKAGCFIMHSNDGISIDGTNRIAFKFDATHCPDLFPALATFAALTDGVSIISGVHRLLTKESNRAKSLQMEFKKLGVKIKLSKDEMHIFGKSQINGGVVGSHHDHRIAMCMGIAGLFANQPITIKNAQAVSKSYPSFWEDLKKLEKVS